MKVKKIILIGLLTAFSVPPVLIGCGGENKTRPPKPPKTYTESISFISKPTFSQKFIAGNPVEIEITLRKQPANFDSLIIKVDGKFVLQTNELKNTYTINWTDSLSMVGYHSAESILRLKDGKYENFSVRFFILSDITPKEYTYTVSNSYPHDKNAYTQGLEFNDGKLYEGTGQFGESQLRWTDLLTGEVKKSVALDQQYFGEGITVMRDKIYQLTWKNKTGFVYNKNTFDKVQEFTYPTEGWGLTNDGKHLIMSDGTGWLYFLDPVTFENIKTIEVCDNISTQVMLNELEYVDGKIWANVYLSDLILQIDPATGKVLSKIDLTGIMKAEDAHPGAEVLNGIAYEANGNRIYVTGKNWAKIYQIVLKEKVI